jgi:hypothetical protein
MEKLYRGPYIDAYCQVWFHLAKLFQRRLKYEKVNGRRLTPSDGNTSYGPLGQVSLPNLELLPFFLSNFQNVNTFCPYFKNYKR